MTAPPPSDAAPDLDPDAFPSPIPYIRWAKENVGVGEFALTMSAVPPVTWEELDLDPRDLALFEFTPYGDETFIAGFTGEWGLPPEHGFIAGSASHAHFCFAASARGRDGTPLGPGDIVLHESPGYLPLLDALSLLQIEPVAFERRFEDGFRLPRERIRTLARDPRAKVLLLTDLHNPSGVALDEEERAFLAELVEETGIEVIADEMYRPFLDPDPGPLHLLDERIVTIGGLNKVHGLSQIRVGWGMATPARVERARRILDATTIHNSCLTDQVAREAWRVRGRLLERARRIAREGWAVLGAWLARSPLEVVEPAGGLVCFPRVPAEIARDGDALREAALALGVNLTPGRFFGAPHHVRLGCGLPPADLTAALARLEPILPTSENAR